MISRLLSVVFPLAITATAAFAQDFPVTVDHAYGSTTIEAEPQRVVTWGWGTQDAVLALGVVPVGIPSMTYGGDGEGLLAWTRAAIEQSGQAMPEILGDGAGAPNFEAIAALDPDVIIAVYSGITEDEYARLSQIAPTVVFPEIRWTASWQDVVRMTGEALGKPDEATQLIADTEQFIASEVAKYPAIAGKTVINFVDGGEGSISIRKAIDPRTKLLLSFGLLPAPELDNSDPGAFNYLLSYENLASLDADILVAFMDSPEAAEAFFAQPFAARAPQVEKGALVLIDGASTTMAVGGAVTPLSLRWALPDLVAAVGAAAEAAEKP